MKNLGESSVASGFGLLWAILISLSWLLPNHFPPWASFHADAWFSIIAVCGAILFLLNGRKEVSVDTVTLFFCVISIVPWIQYEVGIIPFAGQAWISSLYVFGFAMSVQMARRWTELSALGLPNALFLAVLIASIGSAALAMGIWLGVVNFGLDSNLSMGHSGTRQYANLGQPNLLATLLLWGNIATLWFFVNKKISGVTAGLVVLLLSLAISLTGSRQAYLGAILSIALIFIYRSSWRRKYIPWYAVLSLIIMAVAAGVVPQVYDLLFSEGMHNPLARPVDGESPRLQAWKIFLKASGENPWFGYGLTEVAGAQLSVAQDFPPVNGLFGHTHNVLLDFVIWMGYPIAIIFLVGLISWLCWVFITIRKQEDVVLLMVVAVFAVHSMLELPHQYAIYLFPVGMLVGVLNCRLGMTPIFLVSKSIFLLLYVVVAIVLSLTIADYLRIEDSYNKFRFERRGLQYTGDEADKIPKTIILTQFEHWFGSVIYKNAPEAGAQNVFLQEKAVSVFPSSGAMFELGLSFVESGQAEKAKIWFSRICKVSPQDECTFFREEWIRRKNINAAYPSIDW